MPCCLHNTQSLPAKSSQSSYPIAIGFWALSTSEYVSYAWRISHLWIHISPRPKKETPFPNLPYMWLRLLQSVTPTWEREWNGENVPCVFHSVKGDRRAIQPLEAAEVEALHVAPMPRTKGRNPDACAPRGSSVGYTRTDLNIDPELETWSSDSPINSLSTLISFSKYLVLLNWLELVLLLSTKDPNFVFLVVTSILYIS